MSKDKYEEYFEPFDNEDILDVDDEFEDEIEGLYEITEKYYSTDDIDEEHDKETENFEGSADNLEAVINRCVNTNQAIQAAIEHKSLGKTSDIVKNFKKEIFKLICRKEANKMAKAERKEEYFKLTVLEVINYIADKQGSVLYTDGIELSYHLLANLYINRITPVTAQRIHLLYCNSRATTNSRNPARQCLELALQVFIKDKKKFSTDISSVLERFSSRLYGYENIKNYLDSALSLYINSSSPAFDPLLLIGPPGVGKTCVAEAISYALELELINIPLTASSNDAVRLTGTSEQYSQSREGLIINKYKQLKYSNCVMLIDEIDKAPVISQDIISNLTDPKATFEDAFFTVPVNFTKHAFFILTANDAELVPEYLKNRCKILYISDYTEEEKSRIARDYLLPQLQVELGIKTHISISENTIAGISKNRSLREIKRLLKDALGKALNRKKRRAVTIKTEHAESFIAKTSEINERRIGF
jgi:ATP-dependent Lon protease